MPGHEQPDPRLRFVWEEALRAVEYQRASLTEARARAATILSAASISAAFLAAMALDAKGDFGTAAWFGTAAFACAGLTATWVLRPVGNWKFHREVTPLIESYVEGESPADMNEMYRTLAGHLEEDYGNNEGKLNWLYRGISLSCLALVVEIGAFLLDLRNRK
jgi:hypothetical protein